MSGRTVDEAGVIESAVTTALRQAGVAENSAIRRMLVHDAEVCDGVEVIVPDPANGRSISLADRLTQMRLDPQWRGEFPERKPAPSSGRAVSRVEAPSGGVLSVDREHFAAIANGTVRVE
jgi:hypothetical protein